MHVLGCACPECEGENEELLDAIEDFLDSHADAEGNGPANWWPNKAMRLLNDLRRARGKQE
jgi:hypothetical protein